MARLAFGLAAALVWILFIGVPVLIPSYVELAVQHRAAAAAAAAQQARGDQSEANRAIEAERADEGVSAERLSCDARVSACERRWSAFVSRMTPECPDAETPLYELPVRSVRSVLIDAGLDDGGAASPGPAKP